MAILGNAYAGKRVFITGHTGFKGSWLAEWLLGLGAEVWGFSLPPPTSPALFDRLELAGRLHHEINDVRDHESVGKAMRTCRPHFVFHLAAQPIVRAAYAHPVETWTTNVIGTVNVLEAMRGLSEPCAAVIVTTDKVYAPGEERRPHREDDPLGGRDPYSASKSAAEMAVAAYQSSFFALDKVLGAAAAPVALAAARAGNVLGGGDWAPDRLVPDCVRALSQRKSITLRYPEAVRPWQHVLEPLAGYLLLAKDLGSALAERQQDRLADLCGAFNFGPEPSGHRPVRALVEEILKQWPGEWRQERETAAPRESDYLSLDVSKAARVLGWRPQWDLGETVTQTVAWYRRTASGEDADGITRQQIAAYAAKARL